MEGNEQVMSGEIREEVEWCNIRWFDGADTGKRVLLIGDSITLGYGNVVCEKLKEKQIHTAWLCTSKSIDNPSLRKEIEYAMSEYPVELIHFNNGLHGWHLNETTYADALEKMFVWIKETYPMCKLVFATTTHRPAGQHGAGALRAGEPCPDGRGSGLRCRTGERKAKVPVRCCPGL